MRILSYGIKRVQELFKLYVTVFAEVRQVYFRTIEEFTR
jgi:hypothetical protein